MDIVRWGIIGPGRIAHKFACDINLVKNARLIACSSKDRAKAADFKEKYGLEFSGSYEEMLSRPDIDAVYIATTHNFHYENAMLCLKYGKNILCEKAFTVNAMQAEEIFTEASKKKLFVMEAMWARFLPAAAWVREQVRNKAIGDVISIFAQYGVRIPFDPSSRAYDSRLAGGGLLDLGIYPLSFSCSILGNDPAEVYGTAVIGKTGVDEEATAALMYSSGQTAVISYSMLRDGRNNAVIYGSRGKIFIDSACAPTRAVLVGETGSEIVYESTGSNGFEHEIAEATDLILKSETESSVISGKDTTGILKICDSLRKQWEETIL